MNPIYFPTDDTVSKDVLGIDLVVSGLPHITFSWNSGTDEAGLGMFKLFGVTNEVSYEAMCSVSKAPILPR